MPLPSLRRMQIISHRCPAEQRERATRMAVERLDEYGSAWAVAQALGPKLGVGAESLRRWVLQATQREAADAPRLACGGTHRARCSSVRTKDVEVISRGAKTFRIRSSSSDRPLAASTTLPSQSALAP
jgi:transposase